MIIGITGRSGAGKSEVTSKIVQLKKAKRIDADEVVRKRQKVGEDYYLAIVHTFGKEILEKNRRNR